MRPQTLLSNEGSRVLKTAHLLCEFGVHPCVETLIDMDRDGLEPAAAKVF